MENHPVITLVQKIESHYPKELQKHFALVKKQRLEKFYKLIVTAKNAEQLKELIETKTGYITSMVGGSAFEVDNQYNRAVQAAVSRDHPSSRLFTARASCPKKLPQPRVFPTRRS